MIKHQIHSTIYIKIKIKVMDNHPMHQEIAGMGIGVGIIKIGPPEADPEVHPPGEEIETEEMEMETEEQEEEAG